MNNVKFRNKKIGEYKEGGVADAYSLDIINTRYIGSPLDHY